MKAFMRLGFVGLLLGLCLWNSNGVEVPVAEPAVQEIEAVVYPETAEAAADTVAVTPEPTPQATPTPTPAPTAKPKAKAKPRPVVTPTPVPEETVEYVDLTAANGEANPYVGRFSVPDVGLNVGCYGSSAQAVADANDSAAYFDACGHTVIADHVNQGFGAIKGCAIGDRAQLTTEKGEETYVWVGSIQGHNTGKELTDENYTPIDELYPDTLVCYTCNDNWQNVTIVFFAPA